MSALSLTRCTANLAMPQFLLSLCCCKHLWEPTLNPICASSELPSPRPPPQWLLGSEWRELGRLQSHWTWPDRPTDALDPCADRNEDPGHWTRKVPSSERLPEAAGWHNPERTGMSPRGPTVAEEEGDVQWQNKPSLFLCHKVPRCSFPSGTLYLHVSASFPFSVTLAALGL